MKIQVLGSGCPTCHKLFELTKQAAKELSLPQEVEYVTDVQKIVEMGILQSPALAIDGKVVLAGYLPKLDTVKDALESQCEESCCCQSGSDCCGGKCC